MGERSTARMEPGVARTYRTDDIEIDWEPRLCVHAGACFSSSPEAFDPRARPWVRPEAAGPGEVARIVMLCPTGALRFHRLDDGPQEDELIGETVVHPEVNGPLEVRGSFTITDHDGEPVRTMTRALLCRCGQSRNKPFCDNSHRLANFRDPSSSDHRS